MKKEYNGTNLPAALAKAVKALTKRNRKAAIMIGVDFGYRYGWFDRLLIKLGLKKSEDYSCMVLGTQNKKGELKILKIKYLK